jgi:hypothetical protein
METIYDDFELNKKRNNQNIFNFSVNAKIKYDAEQFIFIIDDANLDMFELLCNLLGSNYGLELDFIDNKNIIQIKNARINDKILVLPQNETRLDFIKNDLIMFDIRISVFEYGYTVAPIMDHTLSSTSYGINQKYINDTLNFSNNLLYSFKNNVVIGDIQITKSNDYDESTYNIITKRNMYSIPAFLGQSKDSSFKKDNKEIYNDEYYYSIGYNNIFDNLNYNLSYFFSKNSFTDDKLNEEFTKGNIKDGEITFSNKYNPEFKGIKFGLNQQNWTDLNDYSITKEGDKRYCEIIYFDNDEHNFTRTKLGYKKQKSIDFLKKNSMLNLDFKLQKLHGDYPIWKALTMGGFNSIRGYNYGHLSSSQATLESSIELKIPLKKILVGSSIIGFDIWTQVFFDYGYELEQDSKLNELNKDDSGYGYGVGLTFTPIIVNRNDKNTKEIEVYNYLNDLCFRMELCSSKENDSLLIFTLSHHDFE